MARCMGELFQSKASLAIQQGTLFLRRRLLGSWEGWKLDPARCLCAASTIARGVLV